MLGEFVQDGDFVVWSPGVADFGNEGTSETHGAKIKLHNCWPKNISKSAIGADQQFLTLKSGGILKLPARCLYSEWKTI